MQRFKIGDLAKISRFAVYDVYNKYKTNYSWQFLANNIIIIIGINKTTHDPFQYSDINGNIRYSFYCKKLSIHGNLPIPDCFLEKI